MTDSLIRAAIAQGAEKSSRWGELMKMGINRSTPLVALHEKTNWSNSAVVDKLHERKRKRNPNPSEIIR